MRLLEKTLRSAAITIAVLFIGLILFGILGVWLVDHRATEIALKAFGLIETAVRIVDAGVTRADDLIATSRTEVRQASETITTVGAQAALNGPVLSALNERLETRLAPRITQVQQALGPVRDAVGSIGSAISLISTLPMMAERAPRLTVLDQTFQRLEELSADTSQFRSTLRGLVEARGNDLPAETATALHGLTQRIDARLGEVQANVQALQADIAALQVRLDARKARLLFFVDLMALLATLMFAWILYTQLVVIRHHSANLRRPPAGPLEPR